MAGKRIWTLERLEILEHYLKAGISDKHDLVARLKKNHGMKTVTYDAVSHAILRYDLSKFLASENSDEIFTSGVRGKKIKKQEVDELACLVGRKVYEQYQIVKLKEPKVKSTAKKANLREEISILDLSDIHIGMINEVLDDTIGQKVVTYNHQIFLMELENLQRSIFKIHSILSNSYKLKKLVINMLGDIITNDRIFPEQIFEIEKCVGLQIWDTIPIFVNFFNNLLSIYEEIEVVCVVGNHGRSNPGHYNEPVENNFEYFIYKTWQKQFENSKRIKVIVPNTRRYIHKIGNWKHLLEHGDQMRGATDNAIEKQLKDISLNVEGFDVLHMGHFHKLKETEISDKILVKRNGCWIYKDIYAWDKFKTYSIPKQHFFGCNHKRPETWAYKIDLRG